VGLRGGGEIYAKPVGMGSQEIGLKNVYNEILGLMKELDSGRIFG